MANRLIALSGPGNTGKTTTLKSVIEAFEKSPRAMVTRLISRVDVRAIIEIGDLKIGIETQGDPGSRLGESLELFRNEGCHVIICATRTRGRTVTLVQRCEPAYDVIWIVKLFLRTEVERNQDNRKVASKIVALALQP